ncbi:MAG: hypothetical protein IJ710_05820 [Prevotella sp.]|nr:hypothetical protein [Prevotella sp.]
MEWIIIIVLLLGVAVMAGLWQKTKKEKNAETSDYHSLLSAIQSPICIVDSDGQLASIINKPYVKESAFDINVPEGYRLTDMIDNISDRTRFKNNLREVINDQTANYVNQDFIVKDEHGTLYRALLHIIYYKPGQAYVFINRVRLPKETK